MTKYNDNINRALIKNTNWKIKCQKQSKKKKNSKIRR